MKLFTYIIILLLIRSNVQSQTNTPLSPQYSLSDKGRTTSPVNTFTAASVGLGAFLYLLNPILIYEDKKLYAGITKEISAGFGKLGEHRLAFEYSFIFTGHISHHIRFSYKYDILLKGDMEPSHNLQGTSVLSLGAGYFTNFGKQGYFPELTFGYSLRNHKILIYPHIKLRHTLMFKETDSDITDISFGIIFGFSNLFNDVEINRDY